MNYREFFIEFWRIWSAKRLSAKAAGLLLVSGIALLTPTWWHGIANAVFTNLLNSPIEPFDEAPLTGGIFVALGVALVLLNFWEARRTRNKEIVGIRHKSLGSFPKEAIKRDLPIIQRLWVYRELDVDHGDSYCDGILADHRSVLRRIEKVPIELDGLLHTHRDAPVAYYGLNHIPLAFYMGYLLSDNKYHIQLFELNNDSGRWIQLRGRADQLKLVTDKSGLLPSEERGDIILAMGISYPVHQSEIDELEIPDPLGSLTINAETPQRQLVTSDSHVDQICTVFKTALEQIKNICPNRQKIHFFYAGPVSLCFALGRCISERIDSEVVVYNYSVKESPRYNWSLSMNKPGIQPTTFNKSATRE